MFRLHWASGQHHGLRSLVLGIRAVSALRDNGAHTTGVIVLADQLHTAGLKVDLLPQILRKRVGVRLSAQREFSHMATPVNEVMLEVKWYHY